MDKNIIINIRTIFVTVLFVVAGYVIYRLGPIFFTVLCAALIVVSLEPFVKRLMKSTLFNKPVSRGAAVFMAYLLIIFICAFIFTVALQPVIGESRKLLATLTQITTEFNKATGANISISSLLPTESNGVADPISITAAIFSNITSLFSLLILAIYMSLDWENIKDKLLELLPDRYEEDVRQTFDDIETTVGQWLKGEFILMCVVGLFCYIGLIILGVKYPLALGLMSGLLEIVPIIGPVISAVLAGIIGFADTPIKGFGVIALYILVQQAENNILVPKVMEKVSGFSPLVILLALLIGSQFFGIVGAIMAVPATMILGIILKRILRYSA